MIYWTDLGTIDGLRRRMPKIPILRRFAGALYDPVVAQELAAIRAIDRLRPPPSRKPAGIEQVTAVVKTFERPRALRRLLASVRRFYPELRVIVVDDSRQPGREPGVTTVTLPYDSGVSAGRSEGLSRVRTEYVLLLDDDFIFYRRTDLGAALEVMERHPEIDIMGGAVVNLPLFRTTDYRPARLFPNARPPVHPVGSRIGGLPVYRKVANFFLARTDRLRLVDWDPQLKRLDHADFFTRASGILTTVFNSELRCLHARTPFDAAYMRSRTDLIPDKVVLQRRYYSGGTDARS